VFLSALLLAQYLVCCERESKGIKVRIYRYPGLDILCHLCRIQLLLPNNHNNIRLRQQPLALVERVTTAVVVVVVVVATAVVVVVVVVIVVAGRQLSSPPVWRR